jgi:fermentation-respiration switch protein FrsA (DUF1100 family)
MGDTISSLVFRPPKPTPIHPSDYFYLDVDVYSPLCTNKVHLRRNNRDVGNGNGAGDGNGNGNGDCCGSFVVADDDDHAHGGGCGVGIPMCLETGESDLASLDNSFIGRRGDNSHHNNNHLNVVGGCYTGEACSSPRGRGDDANNANAASSSPSPDVVRNVRDGQVYRIPAFFIRRRNATQTILFSHGNAEDLGMMYHRMKDLALVLGVNIMAYDYTGYGLSMPGPAHRNSSEGGNDQSGEGSSGNNNNRNEGPSENMIYRNIEAAYRYLTRVRKIPPHRIILYGRSLGSGPACYLAAKTSLSGQPVGGLVLHSPFLSVYKVVADLNGLDLGMVGDLFHNEKRARNVRCPTLIIHGRDDEIVPFWHAPRLLAAIPPEFRAAPYYVGGMGHNHIESRCREQYVRVVSNFLGMGANGTCVGNNNLGPAFAVPIHERASPECTGIDSGENPPPTFYVNKTWLRHARVLLREVFSDVGCYVNNTNVDWEGRKRRTSSSAAGSRSSSAAQSVASGTSRRGGGRVVVSASAAAGPERKPSSAAAAAETTRSDARDDEDEFAPWRRTENHHQQQQQQKSRMRSSQRQKQQLATADRAALLPQQYKTLSATMMMSPTPSNAARGAKTPSPSEQEEEKPRLGRSRCMVLQGLTRQRRY